MNDKPRQGPRPRKWLGIALAALSLAAAAVYGLTPFTYAYFTGEPHFGYADNWVGRAVDRSAANAYYQRAWGVYPQVSFKSGDITCQLEPKVSAPGCAHPLKSGVVIYGPYVLLPEGRYRASFEVSAAPGCRNPLRLDVYAGEYRVRPLAYRDITADQGRAEMPFKIGVALAGRSHIEFRTHQLKGPPCAVLKRVNVVRLGA